MDAALQAPLAQEGDADARPVWSRRHEASLGQNGLLTHCHEWHAPWEQLRPLLLPYLEHFLAAELSEERSKVLDVGCGTSAMGVHILEEFQHADLMLVDVEPLVGALRRNHEGNNRIVVAEDDCRVLETVEDCSATVVVDKGTLDAMDSPEHREACWRAMVRTLRRPRGLLVSVSFATAARVLFLRNQTSSRGLELRIHVIRVGAELRLVAFVSSAFPNDGYVMDSFTEEQLDRLFFSGPMWSEAIVNFEHPALPVPITVEQRPSQCGEEACSASSDDNTGFWVWPAARALATHLITHPELVRGRRVVELGAGTGLPGMVAAALGAQEVVLTELTGTLPFLQRNVELNTAACGGRARAMELRWGADDGPGAELRDFDVVLGCELIYRLGTEVNEALVATMAKLAGREGFCLMAVECRDGMIDDLEFFEGVNERFDVQAESLACYGFGLKRDGSDDGERMLYTYRPWPS
mmetsp:Transcript_51608/g.102525  ORF Transcript_51608/g.102525 Transcript_51608/m.102525 type:complete len:468 (-) Transcript_51608:129-1532(-)